MAFFMLALLEKIIKMVLEQTATVDETNYRQRLKFGGVMLTLIAVIVLVVGIGITALLQYKDTTVENSELNIKLINSKDETIHDLRDRILFLTNHISELNARLAVVSEELRLLKIEHNTTNTELTKTLASKTKLETKLEQLNKELFICQELYEKRKNFPR